MRKNKSLDRIINLSECNDQFYTIGSKFGRDWLVVKNDKLDKGTFQPEMLSVSRLVRTFFCNTSFTSAKD
jgi:hypothetical protein